MVYLKIEWYILNGLPKGIWCLPGVPFEKFDKVGVVFEIHLHGYFGNRHFGIDQQTLCLADDKSGQNLGSRLSAGFAASRVQVLRAGVQGRRVMRNGVTTCLSWLNRCCRS